jgi:hypothetical protein
MNTKAELITALAEICGEELTESRIKAYLYSLRELTLNEVKIAFDEFVKDPDMKKFPLPGQFMAKARPQPSSDDEAREAAARILSAVPKFGWSNRKEAQNYIGELGWAVVERQGGWVFICENMKSGMIPSLQAQYRDLAKSVAIRYKSGNENQASMLPQRESVGLIEEKKQNFERQKELAKTVLDLSVKKLGGR